MITFRSRNDLHVLIKLIPLVSQYQHLPYARPVFESRVSLKYACKNPSLSVVWLHAMMVDTSTDALCMHYPN